MKIPPLLLTAALLAVPAYAGFAPGSTAYTKRLETALLAEPAPLAQALARVGYAHKLKVVEVRGAWLRVSEGKNTGWVFSGNLAEQKPAENKGADGLPLAASETSAAAAARPLAAGASDYADRRGLAQARSDVVWMEHTTDAISNDQVQAFRQAQKKGEFQ